MKPDFFKDEHVAALPFWMRLLYSGLWCMADKQGKLEDSPKRIKVELFPYEEKIDIEDGLFTLSKTKHEKNRPFIVRYEVDGTRYIKILSWDTHQRPHHTEKESTIPEPTETDIRGMGMEKGMEKQHNPSATLDNRSLTVKDKRIPTLEEVTEYITKNKFPINPIAFFHHYDAQGWTRGKQRTPITKWKSCVHTWMTNSNNKPLTSPISKEPSPQAIAAEKQAERDNLAKQGVKI